MNNIPTYDAIIVGGGPSGSTCASILVKSGIKTLLLDRATFPRVKLCGGWLSAPIWDILGISPAEYTERIWNFKHVHIRFHGKKYRLKANGYFVRRYEFDNFLLKRSKVESVQEYNVRQIEKDDEGYWLINNEYRTKYLIGAGGTHCPVARALFPKRENMQCGTQEKEFKSSAEEIAATRAGEDGEPEILLHDDMKGYSWNVPKGEWLNIGSGTLIARDVLPAWTKAKAFFEGNGTKGTIPSSASPVLEKMKGHGYVFFNTDHLDFCQAENVFLIGDALGLAQPMTGEGILPAVLSGKLCATAIVEGLPETYKERLRNHPIIKDYTIMHKIQSGSKKHYEGKEQKRHNRSWLRDRIVVKVFALLFSGKSIPGSRLIAKMVG
ncbi:MAG: NAD(P)/FAD-dependent oxidoreductase [Ginsengibacter sp.]